MSATKLDTSGVFESGSQSSSDAHQTLHLEPETTRFRQNGIEFCHSDSIPLWTEMTVSLHDPADGKEITATGIVVDCRGDRLRGYSVSMVFMNLSVVNRARLIILAYSHLA